MHRVPGAASAILVLAHVASGCAASGQPDEAAQGGSGGSFANGEGTTASVGGASASSVATGGGDGGRGNGVEGVLPEQCVLAFPPPAGAACPIDEPGASHYVSPSGDDSNDGTTPALAWATLDHAAQTAPAGSTVRVAEGSYGGEEVMVSKALTIKGGYDAGFATWDPDAHPAVFGGRVTLDDASAVWGGFQLIAAVSPGAGGRYHTILSGTLVRNYIRVSYTVSEGDADSVVAIDATPDAALRMNDAPEIRCNDVYVKGTGNGLAFVDAIRFGPIGGVIDSNRICVDQTQKNVKSDVFWGFGGPNAVTLTNNVLENAQTGVSHVVEIYGDGVEKTVVLTNNTMVSHHGTHIWGYDAGVHWKITNNIVSSADKGSAVAAGATGLAFIETFENNLIFGNANSVIIPTPLASGGNTFDDGATLGTVFVDVWSGNFNLTAEGLGAGTGINVNGVASYGSVTRDLTQLPRPVEGAWDRGALMLP